VKLSELHDLPTVVDARWVAQALDTSYWWVLDAVKAGSFPVPPIRVGRNRILFPTAKVLELLGLDATGRIESGSEQAEVAGPTLGLVPPEAS